MIWQEIICLCPNSTVFLMNNYLLYFHFHFCCFQTAPVKKKRKLQHMYIKIMSLVNSGNFPPFWKVTYPVTTFSLVDVVILKMWWHFLAGYGNLSHASLHIETWLIFLNCRKALWEGTQGASAAPSMPLPTTIN